ncbi:hypothetical protein [Deinococcus sp. UYEF24]
MNPRRTVNNHTLRGPMPGGSVPRGFELLRELVFNSRDWMLLVDAQGQVLFSSPAVTLRFAGFQAARERGSTIRSPGCIPMISLF